jgi:hypothetical protein
VALLDCEITQCAWWMQNESAGEKLERDRLRLSKDSKEMRSSLRGMACSGSTKQGSGGVEQGVLRSVLRLENSHEIGVGKSLSCLCHNSLSQSKYEISSRPGPDRLPRMYHPFGAVSKDFDELLVVGMMMLLKVQSKAICRGAIKLGQQI